MLKSQGRAESIQNLVSFDSFDEDLAQDARQVGLNLYHISDVMAAGRDNM